MALGTDAECSRCFIMSRKKVVVQIKESGGKGG